MHHLISSNIAHSAKYTQKIEKSGDRRWKVVILLEAILSKINPVLVFDSICYDSIFYALPSAERSLFSNRSDFLGISMEYSVKATEKKYM